MYGHRRWVKLGTRLLAKGQPPGYRQLPYDVVTSRRSRAASTAARKPVQGAAASSSAELFRFEKRFLPEKSVFRIPCTGAPAILQALIAVIGVPVIFIQVILEAVIRTVAVIADKAIFGVPLARVPAFFQILIELIGIRIIVLEIVLKRVVVRIDIRRTAAGRARRGITAGRCAAVRAYIRRGFVRCRNRGFGIRPLWSTVLLLPLLQAASRKDILTASSTARIFCFIKHLPCCLKTIDRKIHTNIHFCILYIVFNLLSTKLCAKR